MIQSIKESACHYLFGKEASEIYDTSKFSEEFINQSLETLMRVNIFFLSKKENDGFPFIDPAAFNNQCHLYSLFAARIKQSYKEKSKEEKLGQTQENRFLHLSFLLSYAFLTDRKLLCQVIESGSDKEEFVLPSSKELFYDFVKDSKGILTRTARQSLNEVFEHCIKENFAAAKERSLLHRELYLLSLENLQLLPDRGTKTLYTLPKLAGVAYLINENIAFVIKTKIITKQGTGTLFFLNEPVSDDKPVLIFEAISSDDLSIGDFRKIAERCPSFFERKPSKKNRHDEEETCLFCNETQININPYQERFRKATESIQECLYALGADFIKEIQLPFRKFFEDKEKYPILTDIFQKAVLNIDELGLSMKRPLAFTVEHVYVDNAKHALSPEFRMNSSPESYSKARGFL